MMLAKGLIGIGIVALAVGGLLLVFPNAFSWFGRLPGDFRHQGERVSVFVPLTSMLVVSVVLTVIVNLVGRYFQSR